MIASGVLQCNRLGRSPAAAQRAETSVASVPDCLFAHVVEQSKSHLVRDVGEAQLFFRVGHPKGTASAWTTERGWPGAKLHGTTGS